MGIFDKFKIGFKKSASAFTSGLKEIIVKKEINDENLNKIEEFLIQSDVGVEAASEIKEIISRKKIDPNKELSKEINSILKEYIISLMKPLENKSFFEKKEKLNATLISFLTIISLSPDVNADALFLNPILNLSKIPITILYLFL